MPESEGVFIVDLHDYQHDRPLLAAAGTLLVEIGKDARARGYAEPLVWALGALATVVQAVLRGNRSPQGLRFDLGGVAENQLVDVLSLLDCARETVDSFDSEAGAGLLFLLGAPFTVELGRRTSGEVLS